MKSGVTAYPGMVDKSSWRRTLVHQHSRYFCGFCGMEFADPVAVYTHIDKRHPAGASKRVSRPRAGLKRANRGRTLARAV